MYDLLAFYTNIILDIDNDSFSLMGGNDFFSRAETIVAPCQNAKELDVMSDNVTDFNSGKNELIVNEKR